MGPPGRSCQGQGATGEEPPKPRSHHKGAAEAKELPVTSRRGQGATRDIFQTKRLVLMHPRNGRTSVLHQSTGEDVLLPGRGPAPPERPTLMEHLVHM